MLLKLKKKKNGWPCNMKYMPDIFYVFILWKYCYHPQTRNTQVNNLLKIIHLQLAFLNIGLCCFVEGVIVVRRVDDRIFQCVCGCIIMKRQWFINNFWRLMKHFCPSSFSPKDNGSKGAGIFYSQLWYPTLKSKGLERHDA